jgi:hypothetical protein
LSQSLPPRPPHLLDLQERHLASLVNALQSPAPIDARPWHQLYPQSEIRAMVLLLTAQEGPLRNGGSLVFSDSEALLAAMVARAWGLARNPKGKGFLVGKPAYEAWDMLCARLRAATAESPGWGAWWLRVVEALRLQAETVPPMYAQVWEASHKALPRFQVAKYDKQLWNRIIMAAGLIAREPGWRFQWFTFMARQDADFAVTFAEEIVHE